MDSIYTATIPQRLYSRAAQALETTHAYIVGGGEDAPGQVLEGELAVRVVLDERAAQCGVHGGGVGGAGCVCGRVREGGLSHHLRMRGMGQSSRL